MSRAGRSAFRHRDFALFWVSLVTEAFALQMSFVAIGWQVYSIRENPLDLGLSALRSSSRCCCSRYPPDSWPIAFRGGTSRGDDGPQPRRPRRAARGDDRRTPGTSGRSSRSLRAGSRERDRRAGRSRAHAVARARGDPRQRARAAIDRVPAVGRRRARDRRAPVRDPAGARLRRRDRARARRARLRARDAERTRAGGGRRRRARRGHGGGSAHPSDERAARRDLARPLRRAVRRSGGAAADLREGHPRGRADGPRSPARRARDRLARSRRASIARYPIRGKAGPKLFARRRGLRRLAWSSSGSRARCGSRCSRSLSARGSTW